MIDPKKQRPVGVPYDSYSGYIVMIAKIPDIGSNYGSRPQSVQLFGKFPTYVIQKLQTTQGRFQEVQFRFSFQISQLSVHPFVCLYVTLLCFIMLGVQDASLE